MYLHLIIYEPKILLNSSKQDFYQRLIEHGQAKDPINDSKRISLLNKKIKCLECKDFSNSVRMEYMLHLLLKNILGIEIESGKLNEFLNTTFIDLLFRVDCDFNKMDIELKKLTKKECILIIGVLLLNSIISYNIKINNKVVMKIGVYKE